MMRGVLPGRPPEHVMASRSLPKILVFTRTTAYRHDSIPDAVTAFRELGAGHGFAVDATEAPDVFESGIMRLRRRGVPLHQRGSPHPCRAHRTSGVLRCGRRVHGGARRSLYGVRLAVLRRTPRSQVRPPSRPPAGNGDRRGPRSPGDRASRRHLGVHRRVVRLPGEPAGQCAGARPRRRVHVRRRRDGSRSSPCLDP